MASGSSSDTREYCDNLSPDKRKLVKESKLNANAKEFVPEQQKFNRSSDEIDDVDFYTTACINEITDNPPDFDDIIVNFMDEFLTFLDSDDKTKKMAISIAEQCICERNSCYMGVKLANVLKKLSPEKFLSAILNYCQEVFNDIFEEKSENSNYDRILGYSLFVGEMYVQFRSKNKKRYDILSEVVLEICERLCSFKSSKHIYILLQLMKLVGQSLEEDNREQLSSLMMTLDAMSESELFNDRTRRQYRVIKSAHESKWHLNESSQQKENGDKVDDACDPTLYGPDGEVITLEENDFLTSCVNSKDVGEELFVQV